MGGRPKVKEGEDDGASDKARDAEGRNVRTTADVTEGGA